MYRISPFTPLFFNPTTDRFGIKCKYVQVFANSDIIFIELIGDKSDVIPVLTIRNLVNNCDDTPSWNTWDMNDNQIIYFHTITGLENGYYEVIIDDLHSEIFKVTDNIGELSKTTLIQYSMKDNRQRTDSIWWIDGMQYFFDFRVPGGFKDAGWGFGVDNEQFITSNEEIIELYSYEYTTKIFTLGNAIGCPIWFAELFNRILCCNYIYFDSRRFVRKESSVPELNQQIEGIQSFIFNQALQSTKLVDPILEERNQFYIRRVNDSALRNAPINSEYKPISIKL